MKNVSKTENLNPELNILELEERLEMVNLVTFVGDEQWRCGGPGDEVDVSVEIQEG